MTVVASGGRRVLVVDDSHDMADVVADMLTDLGHDVVVAYDSRRALTIAQEFEFDVALLDVGMPVIDGYELARQLRAQTSDRPVRFVAITGFTAATYRARSWAEGFDDHVIKPVDHARLVALMALLT